MRLGNGLMFVLLALGHIALSCPAARGLRRRAEIGQLQRLSAPRWPNQTCEVITVCLIRLGLSRHPFTRGQPAEPCWPPECLASSPVSLFVVAVVIFVLLWKLGARGHVEIGFSEPTWPV